MKYYIVLFLCFLQGFGQHKIDKIQFEGLKKNSETFLTQLIQTKQDAVIDTVLLQQDIKKLKRLTGISNATYKIVGATLVFDIEENHTLIPAINIWSVDDTFSYKLGLYEYNFAGRNITLGGYYQYNGESSFGANLFAPYLLSNKLGVAINAQQWSSKEPFYYTDIPTDYIYKNSGIEAFITYERNFKNNFRAGLNYSKDTYEYQSGHLDATIAERIEVNKFILKALYEYNTLDFNYQYVKGVKNVFTLQQHFTDNDFQSDFLAWWNDIMLYKTLGSKGNFASRLRVGLATNTSSVFAPFVVDNNVNIRGVGNLIDRGTGSLVLNAEYRHTLYEKSWFVLQGNTFVDMGTWRSPGGHLSDFIEFDKGQLYSGLGIRLIHKYIFNAIFRLDYGYSFANQSGGIVFGIGQYF
ncbi:MAG: outer membrane protein assembly factor [Flavobacteriaceae bacterium]